MAVQRSVVDDSRFFDSMMDLVPVAYYYPEEADEALPFKSMNTKNNKAPAHKLSKNKVGQGKLIRETRKKKQALLQARYDPAQIQTVMETQNQTAVKDKAMELVKERMRKQMKAKALKLHHDSDQAPRERLRATVEALKGSRTLLSGEEKRAIRLEKRQAQAEKQRAKRVARKETLKKRKAEEISAPNNFRGATFSDDEEPSAEVIAKKQRNLASQGVVTKKTKADVHDKTPTGVDSSDGEDDDAFEFSHMAQGADVFTKDKKGRKLTKGKALRKAVGQKERLDKLAASNPEKYKEEKKRIEMQKSLQRLHGARIIDDPKILAKQIKRIVKKKEKSLAKKEDEKQALIDHHASRQRKREANLKARKTKGKNRAEHRRTDIRRAQASLGKRPGFEGQGGFLN